MLEKKSVAMTSMFSGDISFMDCPRIHHLNKIPLDSLVVLGIPVDNPTSNRPGARLGLEGSGLHQKCSPGRNSILGMKIFMGHQ